VSSGPWFHPPLCKFKKKIKRSRFVTVHTSTHMTVAVQTAFAKFEIFLLHWFHSINFLWEVHYLVNFNVIDLAIYESHFLAFVFLYKKFQNSSVFSKNKFKNVHWNCADTVPLSVLPSFFIYLLGWFVGFGWGKNIWSNWARWSVSRNRESV
jgi:hypothetical protein